MKRLKALLLTSLFTLMLPGLVLAASQLYATGVSKYDPSQAWNGYLIMAGANSARLIDMNGNLVHEWDLQSGGGGLAKVFPGGHLLTSIYPRFNQQGQGVNTVAVLDFDGNPIRTFNRYYQVQNPTDILPREADGTVWLSRQHHDFQIEGNSVGFYYPDGENVDLLNGDMLILAHRNTVNNAVTPGDYKLQDDAIYIIDKDGKVTWEWFAADHFIEFQMFSEENKALLALAATESVQNQEANGYDWWHINCASWLGENQWYDAGDERFHPKNIIADSRESAMLFIIDHVTGEIVWLVRPDHPNVGPLYGVHHTHMIPKGLPGAGNIMVFDNGGENALFKSLGAQNQSQVIEFNPVSMEMVWQYPTLGQMRNPSWNMTRNHQFFSYFISNAQRLPNGNTLIHEGNAARAFEVTPMGDIVWDYVSPYNTMQSTGQEGAFVYRSYRVPYDWVPQLQRPTEVPVYPLKPEQLQIPDANGNYPNIMPSVDTSLRDSLAPRVTLNVPADAYVMDFAPAQ